MDNRVHITTFEVNSVEGIAKSAHMVKPSGNMAYSLYWDGAVNDSNLVVSTGRLDSHGKQSHQEEMVIEMPSHEDACALFEQDARLMVRDGYQMIQPRRNPRKNAIMPIMVKYLDKEITCDQCGNTDWGGHRGAGLGYTGKKKMGTICADCKYQFENDGMILPHGEMAKVMFIDSRRNPMPAGKSLLNWAEEEDAGRDISYSDWMNQEQEDYYNQAYAKASGHRNQDKVKKAKAKARGFRQWSESEIDEPAHSRRNPSAFRLGTHLGALPQGGMPEFEKDRGDIHLRWGPEATKSNGDWVRAIDNAFCYWNYGNGVPVVEFRIPVNEKTAMNTMRWWNKTYTTTMIVVPYTDPRRFTMPSYRLEMDINEHALTELEQAYGYLSKLSASNNYGRHGLSRNPHGNRWCNSCASDVFELDYCQTHDACDNCCGCDDNDYRRNPTSWSSKLDWQKTKSGYMAKKDGLTYSWTAPDKLKIYAPSSTHYSKAFDNYNDYGRKNAEQFTENWNMMYPDKVEVKIKPNLQAFVVKGFTTGPSAEWPPSAVPQPLFRNPRPQEIAYAKWLETHPTDLHFDGYPEKMDAQCHFCSGDFAQSYIYEGTHDWGEGEEEYQACGYCMEDESNFEPDSRRNPRGCYPCPDCGTMMYETTHSWGSQGGKGAHCSCWKCGANYITKELMERNPMMYSTEIKAIAVIAPNDNGVNGEVVFTQDGSMLHIDYNITGLSDGEHGFHIHEYGDLTDGCESACAHFNPYGMEHGSPDSEIKHLGDLGNIISSNNLAKDRMTVDYISLVGGKVNCIVGRMIIVHADRDDLGLGGDAESLITGNAGKRVGCGVIGLMESPGAKKVSGITPTPVKNNPMKQGCGCGGKTRKNGKGCGCGTRRNPTADVAPNYSDMYDYSDADATPYRKNPICSQCGMKHNPLRKNYCAAMRRPPKTKEQIAKEMDDARSGKIKKAQGNIKICTMCGLAAEAKCNNCEFGLCYNCLNSQDHKCPVCDETVDYNNLDWITMRKNPALMMEDPIIHLEYHDDNANSHKYWEGQVLGSSATIQWGRVPGYGRDGTTQEKTYRMSSPDAATQFILSKAYDKRRKGYTPTV